MLTKKTHKLHRGFTFLDFFNRIYIFCIFKMHVLNNFKFQIVYFNNQHFMYTIDHNITWEFIWSIVQQWLIFGDGDPFAFTDGDD